MSLNARRFLLGIIIVIALSISLAYIVGYLTQVPYPGFLIQKDSNTIIKIYDQDQSDKIQTGDQVISINGILVAEDWDSLNIRFWEGLSPGYPVPIKLERGGHQFDITWRFTGRTSEAFQDRFFSPIWLAIFFWGCGVSAYLTIRPTDTTWKVFLAINFLLSLWFVTFFGPASDHYWLAPYVERISAWILIPLFLGSPFRFPNNLLNEERTSTNILILVLSYLTAGILLALDLSKPALHLSAYGLALALLVEMILYITLYLIKSSARSQIKLIYQLMVPSYLCTLFLIITQTQGTSLPLAVNIVLILVIQLYPLSVFYTIWAGKVPNYQFRANRYLALVLYSIIIILVLMALVMGLENYQRPVNPTLSVLIAVVTATITSQSYPYFEKMVDRFIFRIPVASTDLLRSFSKQLDRTKDTASISSLMGSMILPSLMVRQSALIEILSRRRIRNLDMYGLLQSQLPDASQVQELLALDVQVIPPQTIRDFPKDLHWVRVVLPLNFDDQTIGVWLLGQRDPNNLYSDQVVDLLQALAQQTTIALINHSRSQRLSNLYKANIDRNEEERARLARNLHDDTLNDLALLQRGTNDPYMSDGIQRVITSLRKTINGLRPEMLSYGLVTALIDLGDALRERQNTTQIIVQIDGAPIPIAPNVEQHLYRIVQQACENSLRHSQANLIRILGIITEKAIHLTVVDNGIGFDIDSTLDFSELIANQHFGLAGMHERAALINANLNIQSSSTHGTRISIFWKNPKVK